MYVIVVGGGKLGYHLTKALLKEGYEVLLIEKDKNRWNFLERELGEAVILGDGCELRVLEEVGCARADVVVAATGHDEDNLTICQLAKRRFAVPRVIARVNMPQNEAVLKALGVDETICGTRIVYDLIRQRIDWDRVLPLALLKEGGLEIAQITVSRYSPAVGRALASLELPSNCLFISIIRGNEVLIPTGTVSLEAGDTIIVLIPQDQLENLQNLLSPKEK